MGMWLRKWLLQREGFGPFAGRTALTLASTWLVFCFCNFVFSHGCLSSVENRRAPSVGELVQMGRVGVGASRPESAPAPLVPAPPAPEPQGPPPKGNAPRGVPKRATLLSGLFVMNGKVSRLAPNRLTAGVVAHCSQLILGELNTEPVKERADDVVSTHTRIVLEGLRIKNVMRSAREAHLQGEFPKSPEFHVKTLAGIEAQLQGIDPLEMETERCLDELRKAEAELAKLREVLAEVVGIAVPGPGEPWAHAFLRKHGWPNFNADVQRFVPGDSHPRLALAEDRPARPADRPELTVLYFPDTEAARRYAIGLQLSHTSNNPLHSRNGYNIEAQFFVVDLRQPTEPYLAPRTPVITVLHREPWWCGLRPVAVHVAEAQLADRLFEECGTIARGARIAPKLVPTNEERKAEYQRAIRYLLEKRLGGEATGEEWATEPTHLVGDSHLPARTRTLDEIVVWPRRLNGGTWWGGIQFSVVFLGLFFLLEWFRVADLMRRCDPAAPRHAAPTDIHEALQGVTSNQLVVRVHQAEEVCERVNSRMASLRYIVGALPLVGFLGSVAGLSNSLIGASGISSDSATERQSALQEMQIALGTAFDKSILAFVMTILCLGGLFLLVRRLGDLRTRLGRPETP